MEARKDALYEVRIKTPAGTLVELKSVDYDSAKSACDAILASSKDEKLVAELGRCMNAFGFTGFGGNGYSISISASLPRTDTGEKQTCPRRMREMGPWDRKEFLDTWELRGKDKCCSFCGSLHPDRVIELIHENGLGIVNPSDKGYKWYIHRADVPNASFGGIKYYRQHDTDDFRVALQAVLDEQKVKEANCERFVPPADRNPKDLWAPCATCLRTEGKHTLDRNGDRIGSGRGYGGGQGAGTTSPSSPM